MRPGIAVIPPASMTTSAASTAAAEAVPTLTMLPPSVRIASPAEIGLRQSPATIAPRLVTAILMTTASMPGFAQLVVERVGAEQVLDQPDCRIPIVGAEAVPGGHEARTCVEHLVLLMAGAEFRSHRVPAGLEEFHLVFRLHGRGTLRRMDDLLQHRILEVVDR